MLFKEGTNLNDPKSIEKSLQEAFVNELSSGISPGLKIKTFFGLICLALTAVTYLPLGKRDYPTNRNIAILAVPAYLLCSMVISGVNFFIEKKGSRVFISKSHFIDINIDFPAEIVTISVIDRSSSKAHDYTVELKNCFFEDGTIDPEYIDNVKKFVNEYLKMKSE